MEHLLYICENYAAKIWALLGRGLTLALSHHSGDYIQAITLTTLEIVYNKPHPSTLLHLQDSKTRKVIILLLQEIKRDIIYRHAALKTLEDKMNYYTCGNSEPIVCI
jgi:hypothetical protein